jgi:VWFA-related protein
MARLAAAVFALLLPALSLFPPGLSALAADPALSTDPMDRAEEMENTVENLAGVRLLIPPGSLLEGKTEIEILTVDPKIYRVELAVDGETVERLRLPPWRVKLQLASPPREQVLTARGYNADDRLLGEHTVTINQISRPFRTRITELVESGGQLKVTVTVDVPRKALLERVEIYQSGSDAAGGEILRASFEGTAPPPFTAEFPSGGADSFVRAVAILADGRTIEDARVPGALADLTEEVEVNLVQLQVLVTEKNGAPVAGLTKADFQVLEDGKPRPVEQLYVADDVTLMLGLVLDTSGSMQPIWGRTVEAARQFLRQTLTPRDRAFLVTFDQQLHLAQSVTADRSALLDALTELKPTGGTALMDSVLFSLLQFTDEPGRRALVVITDGFDGESTTRPERIVEFGEKLGVPVYLLALPSPYATANIQSGPGAGIDPGTATVHQLRLITDPTGGRLLRPPVAQGLDRAFHLINADLRRQYVLTYTTERPLEQISLQGVKIKVPGKKGVKVRTVMALDQVE